jgi:hypothetical protein
MLVCVAGLEIRVAGRGDTAETAQMLARAFHDDPVFDWCFPAEGLRHRRLRRYFVTELHHESLRHGAVEVACVDGRVAGAAVWFPPGTWSPGTEVSALPGYLGNGCECSPISPNEARTVSCAGAAGRARCPAPGAAGWLGLSRGISGRSISPTARVLGAADAYQALREPRPHRPARSADEAAQELHAEVRSGRA